MHKHKINNIIFIGDMTRLETSKTEIGVNYWYNNNKYKMQ